MMALFSIFPVLFFFVSNAFGSITLDSSNASYKASPIFSWPIADGGGCSDWDRVLYSSDLSIIALTDNLKFTIHSSISSSSSRDVVAEYVASNGSVASININGAATNVGYSDGMSFNIKLSDFCTVAQAQGVGGGTCASAHNILTGTHTVRVGTIVHTAAPHSFSNPTYTNGTEQMDYTSYSFRLVQCPTRTNSFTPANATGFETYGIIPKPGDTRATILVVSSPDIATTDFNIIGKLFLFQKSSTALSTNMTLSDATVKVYAPGTAASQTVVNGLENDQTYNVQMAYVNEGGFVSRPGPPNPAGNAPQVTPSQIAGYLADSGCFVATATYSNRPFWLNPLRQFRDEILLQFPAGRKFVQWYYSWSPGAANYVIQHSWLKPILFCRAFPHRNVYQALSFLLASPVKNIEINKIVLVSVLFSVLFSVSGCLTFAESTAPVASPETVSRQPYLDKLLEKDALEGDESLLKLPRNRKPLVTEPNEMQPYMESLKRENEKNLKDEPRDPGSAPKQPYLDKLLDKDEHKSEKQDPNNPEAYIQSLKDGKELQPKKDKKVQNTAQIGLMVAANFDFTGGSKQANSFESVYSTKKKFNPGFDFSYERQVFRDPVIGAFGPHLRVTGLFFKGTGRFTKQGIESETKFSFLALPIGAGVGYRAIQPRLIVPFAQAGLMAIPFMETRDDDQSSRKGISSSYHLVAGVQLSLDWIGRKDSWDRYDAYGILHTYLSAQYMIARPLTGAVDFKMELFFVGFGFEF